eukprot:9938004-Alexandrium_andersonii.AAC.1
MGGRLITAGISDKPRTPTEGPRPRPRLGQILPALLFKGGQTRGVPLNTFWLHIVLGGMGQRTWHRAETSPCS